MRKGLKNIGLVNKLKIIQNLLQCYAICKDYPYSDSRTSRIIPMLIDIEKNLDCYIKKCKKGFESPYTSFLVGPTPQEECNAIEEEQTLELWHNGEGIVPTDGDTVYSDAAGTTLFVVAIGTTHWCDEIPNNELKTDENGMIDNLNCK